MITHEYKIRLIHFCIELLGQRAIEIQSEIDSVLKDANDYGPQKDRYDGFKNQQMRKIEMLTLQMHIMQDDKRIFQQINLDDVCVMVKMGALFSTNEQTILVATSMGKVDFEGDSLFIISPKVPFYEAVKGAKIGDNVKFRDKTISINALS